MMKTAIAQTRCGEIYRLPRLFSFQRATLGLCWGGDLRNHHLHENNKKEKYLMTKDEVKLDFVLRQSSAMTWVEVSFEKISWFPWNLNFQKAKISQSHDSQVVSDRNCLRIESFLRNKNRKLQEWRQKIYFLKTRVFPRTTFSAAQTHRVSCSINDSHHRTIPNQVP